VIWDCKGLNAVLSTSYYPIYSKIFISKLFARCYRNSIIEKIRTLQSRRKLYEKLAIKEIDSYGAYF